MLRSLLKYWITAQNAHDIHSPFVFDFYNHVFKSKFRGFAEIEKLRIIQASYQQKITINDFGAGSRYTKNTQRTIASITIKSAKSKKWASLLSEIIRHYGYENVVELGTSLGFTTAYLAQYAKNVSSFEGCAETLKIAKQNLESLKLHNVSTIQGNIDKNLPIFLAEQPTLDFVLFDANHKYEPTIRYFEQCLTRINNKSCFVFDDIYWSKGMTKAWNEIKSNPKVTVSIDLYSIGIVFFNKALNKQDFVLK